MTRDSADNIKLVVWSFLTPFLIAIVGFLTVRTLNSIDEKFEKFEQKMDRFMVISYDIQVRVQRLEDRSEK